MALFFTADFLGNTSLGKATSGFVALNGEKKEHL